MPKTDFIYHTDIAFSDEHGVVQMVQAENSGTVTGAWSEALLVEVALAWVAGEVGADPKCADVINFTYSTLDPVDDTTNGRSTTCP